jgi:hypothetical protein
MTINLKEMLDDAQRAIREELWCVCSPPSIIAMIEAIEAAQDNVENLPCWCLDSTCPKCEMKTALKPFEEGV